MVWLAAIEKATVLWAALPTLYLHPQPKTSLVFLMTQVLENSSCPANVSTLRFHDIGLLISIATPSAQFNYD